jgi:hypothetical protein
VGNYYLYIYGSSVMSYECEGCTTVYETVRTGSTPVWDAKKL